jgi:hypothetical protein
MESKLPSSLDQDDYEIPRGVQFKLTTSERVFLAIFLGATGAICFALLAICYVIVRFFIALAFA